MTNRIDLYNKTVNVLFDAYFKDTLRHGNCSACAVGNICAEAATFLGLRRSVWAEKFFTPPGHQQLIFENNNPCMDIESALKLIEATGYTWQELARVEFAFETAPGRHDNDKDLWMYNGLEAVLSVLKDIHGIEDDTQEQTRFKQHYKTLIA